MFGRGEGTNGAGGPGILQTFGIVFLALPRLPLVTGVFGGLIATLNPMMNIPYFEVPTASSSAAARWPPSELAHNSVREPREYPRAMAWQTSMANRGPEAAPTSPQQLAGDR